MDAVFDRAVLDYYNNEFEGKLLIHNYYGEPDEMDLSVYLRNENNLLAIEEYALDLCTGKTLDIGAGLGAMTKILQERGIITDALENSPELCRLMKKRGINNIINQGFFSDRFRGGYDTLLFMMNGIGLCGHFNQLPLFFARLKALLNAGGQVLLDSSDVGYIYDGVSPKNNYYGEIDYQYEYKGNRGPWFKWLYLDAETLGKESLKNGFDLQVISTEESGQYLGRLTRN